ncbi:MAG: hypothetical protein HWE14_01875 [Flavobacteriia bacterium]|nr:hypothetical protein [Flavobacteriia bacterium]
MRLSSCVFNHGSSVIVFLVFSVILTSCEFNQSVNKNPVSGEYSRGDGLSCDAIFVKINGIQEQRFVYTYGEKINFNFEGISGLVRENGLCFPGASMLILDKHQDTVMYSSDMFAENDEGMSHWPLSIYANFNAKLDYSEDNRYELHVKIWDKKGSGTFEYKVPFTMVENELLTIETKELIFDHIYMWNETTQLVLADNLIDRNQEYYLLFEGVDSLMIVNDNVFPSLEISLIDALGDTILYQEDLLEMNDDEGVDYDIFNGVNLPVKISFPMGRLNNPCVLTAAYTDMKSDRRIDVTCELVVK